MRRLLVCSLPDAKVGTSPVLQGISSNYPERKGRFLTCYSPVRRSITRRSVARLACLIHAASVRPEPGSNSPLKNGLHDLEIAFLLTHLCLTKASHLHLSKQFALLRLVRNKRFKSTIQFSKNAPLSRFVLPWEAPFRKGQGEILPSPPPLCQPFLPTFFVGASG